MQFSKGMRICIFFSLFLVSAGSKSGEPWAYEGTDGPRSWPTTFPQCAGVRQSPINIQRNIVRYSQILEPFQFKNLRSGKFPDYTLQNDGHKVLVLLPDTWGLNFGKGKSCFRPLQMHWHWGSSNSKGSEHTIDGKAYPLEGHLVTWNCHLYKTAKEAVSAVNGLAVLGVFYEIDDKAEADPIIQAVTKHFNKPTFRQCPCKNKTDKAKLQIPGFDISKALPKDTKSFYRYMGSLTTPPCTENVLWTVYKETKKITSSQMNAFRSLLYPTSVGVNQPMVDNYRPVTPLNPTSPISTIRLVSASFNSAFVPKATFLASILGFAMLCLQLFGSPV